jgi:hypothetical protein
MSEWTRRADFVRDRMTNTILSVRWCDIIVLNVHAPTEDETNNMKNSFYEKLDHVFDNSLNTT